MTVWFITGSNRGIGLALVERLAGQGERVFAASRDPDAASALRRVAEKHPSVTMLRLDVRSAEAVHATASGLGGQAIDVLINNAGVYGDGSKGALDVDPDAFLDALAINTVAPIRVMQALLPNLKSARGGAKVVNISSTMGSFAGGGTGYLAYRASKAALNRAVQASGAELARVGIVSVAMHPGWVRTDMGGPAASLSPAEAAAGIIETIGRLGPQDAGRFVEWNGRPAAW